MGKNLDENFLTIIRTGTLKKSKLRLRSSSFDKYKVIHGENKVQENCDIAHQAKMAGWDVDEKFRYKIMIPIKKKY
ncbi:hypothetical protein ES703_42346 [subsurface metagenome]